MYQWKCLSFDELTNHELYDLLKLRVDVFVVEQTCPYPELDDKDRAEGTRHLLGYKDDQLIACARLLGRDISYPGHTSIGRVATAQECRGNGLGHELIRQALASMTQYFPDQPVKIGAQAHLEAFYQGYGFVTCSEPYLEDGIPHIDMVKA